MRELLQENTLLLLFLVSAIGYAIGNISIKNTSLGVSAVLFTGLAFGGLDPSFQIPEIIIFLGLSMFVYTIGLSSGPAFFYTFKRSGASNIKFIVAVTVISLLVTVAVHFLFGFEKVLTSSVYAGSFTNTPALAALLDVIAVNNNNGVLEAMQNRAVVGYSLTYPMGVIAVMIAIAVMIKLLRVDFDREEEALKQQFPVKQNVTNRVIEVTQDAVVGKEIRDIKSTYPYKMVFGRIERDGERFLSTYDTRLQKGDKVLVVADADDLDRITKLFGQKTKITVSNDNKEYAERRIFVSNPDIAGEKLATLNIHQKFSAIISRITRGDIDILATSDTVVELGDRVRVISRRKDIPKIKALFGDSYEALSHINLLSFGLGLALGLMLGMINIGLTETVSFNLGYAGGPLLVALLLGNLRRTGRIVWTLPYSANLTLQQIGLTLMLAGIGINSGNAFFETVATQEGLLIFFAGALLTFISAVLILYVGYKWLKIPFSLLMGMTASQPAILDFAMRRTDNKLPTIGYTSMLPILLILKLFVVQLLYAFL